MHWCYDQCAEEAHRPVDCETVAKWVLKNSAESENMNWYTTSGMIRKNLHHMCLFIYIYFLAMSVLIECLFHKCCMFEMKK